MSETSIQIIRDGKVMVHVPLWNFPKSAQLRECYETDTEIIIVGDPLDDEHSCDMLGCSSCFHVRYRFKKENK